VAGGEEMAENSYDAYSATEPAIRQHIVRIRAGILLTQAIMLWSFDLAKRFNAQD
jgi:hypothetical protein